MIRLSDCRFNFASVPAYIPDAISTIYPSDVLLSHHSTTASIITSHAPTLPPKPTETHPPEEIQPLRRHRRQSPRVRAPQRTADFTQLAPLRAAFPRGLFADDNTDWRPTGHLLRPYGHLPAPRGSYPTLAPIGTIADEFSEFPGCPIQSALIPKETHSVIFYPTILADFPARVSFSL